MASEQGSVSIRRIPQVRFGHEFVELDQSDLEDLATLEREGAYYTAHWQEHLQDFRHVRIRFTPEEATEYARRMWAMELWLRAGRPDQVSGVDGIPDDIAAEAEDYSITFRDGTVHRPWLCPAAFLGSDLENLVCSNVPERCTVVEEIGKEETLRAVRRTIEALTPAIRAFSNRDADLATWTITREKDARDLLFVMLRGVLGDIRREEPVPSRGGGYKIIDLYSPMARLFIELKWVDSPAKWKRVRDEIDVDIQSYSAHPGCKILVFVVVDVARCIADPRLVESDLTVLQQIGKAEIDVSVRIAEP